MPDYQKAVIYTIKTGNSLYIGSTCNFAHRKSNHKYCINNEVRIGSNSKLYQVIRENNNEWTMEKYKDYPCNNNIQLGLEEEHVRMELKADLNSCICETGLTQKEYYKQKHIKNKISKIQPFYKERKQLCKEVFLWKFKKHFRFTKNNTDYLSKKIVCDLLDLDYKSKKDVRNINDVLIDYGVSYDRKKMIKRIRGAFLGISLK